MNDVSNSHPNTTREQSWQSSTGQWMVEKLRLAPSESLGQSSGLQPEDVRRLKSIAKHGSTDFYFPKNLEDQFKREQREGSKAERLCAALMAMTLFAFGPLWAPWMLSLPEGTKTLELWLCLGVATPVFAIAAFLQYRYVASEFAEISLIVAFTIEVIVIEILRIQAAALGAQLIPVMTAAVPITVFVLLGLTTKRRTYLFAGYFFVLWAIDISYASADTQRDASVWMTEAILLTLAWIAALFNRISARRAWAANRCLELIDETGRRQAAHCYSRTSTS